MACCHQNRDASPRQRATSSGCMSQGRHNLLNDLETTTDLDNEQLVCVSWTYDAKRSRVGLRHLCEKRNKFLTFNILERQDLLCGISKFASRIWHEVLNFQVICCLIRWERCIKELQFIEYMITKQRASGKDVNGIHMYLRKCTRRWNEDALGLRKFCKKWNEFMTFHCVGYTSTQRSRSSCA